MSESTEHLSEEEAVRLWKRAAELQAEAAHRAEAPALEGPAADDHASGGYALTHVRAAAVEAGINEEFVDAALADLRAERVVAVGHGGQGRVISRWVLGDPPAAVTARRVIMATPAEVLAAMEAVLPAEPFSLTLQDREGDPARGGVLRFDIPGATFTGTGANGFTMEASWADFRNVLVSLNPLPGSPSRTEMTVRAPVAWAWRINGVISGALVGGGGLLGAGVGGGLAAAAASLLAGSAPVVVAGVVSAALMFGSVGASGALSLWGVRAAYRYSLSRGARGLDGLLSAVATRAQGGWGLATTTQKDAQ